MPTGWTPSPLERAWPSPWSALEMGLINETHTQMDLSFGNRTSALAILHQMAEHKGFGRIVGQGIRRMKSIFEKDYGAGAAIMQDIGMESKGLEFSEYMTKESLAQQGGYGLALKGPQHDEALADLPGHGSQLHAHL